MHGAAHATNQIDIVVYLVLMGFAFSAYFIYGFYLKRKNK